MRALLRILVVVLVVLQCVTPASAAPDPPADATSDASVRVQLQVFRVLGDFSGDLSLTDNIWSGVEKPDAETERALTFFTLAKARLANLQLTVDADGWRWNDGTERSHETVLPFGAAQAQTNFLGDRVALLAQPTVILAPGPEASINLTSEQTIEYFEPVRGNLFELKNLREPTGITFGVRVGNIGTDRILLKDFSVVSKTVEERKPIAGVSLNVGEPVIRTREFNVSMNLKPEEEYGILIHSKEMPGLLLVRLRLDVQPAPAHKP